MSRVCQLTGKRANNGMAVSHSHVRTKKLQQVNLQERRLWWAEGNRFVKLRVSTRALKTIQKKGLGAYAPRTRRESRQTLITGQAIGDPFGRPCPRPPGVFSCVVPLPHDPSLSPPPPPRPAAGPAGRRGGRPRSGAAGGRQAGGGPGRHPAGARPAGARLPAARHRRRGGGDPGLEDFRGHWLILYFYPRDFTSGCTLEARGFQRDRQAFAAAGAEVVGVSADGQEEHASFCQSEGLGYPLLSDPEGRVSRAYGSWIAPFSQRHTFLIDPEGVLRARWVAVRPAGHSQEVLTALRDLQEKSAG